jgi:hypothetical protein
MRSSKWKGLLGEMYKYKYYATVDYSLLSVEKMENNFKYYFENFGIELDFSQCSSRPAMKATAKILSNCVWGKISKAKKTK